MQEPGNRPSLSDIMDLSHRKWKLDLRRYTISVRDPVRENLNFKGFEKKTWTPLRFFHRGPNKAVEHDSDIHFDLT